MQNIRNFIQYVINHLRSEVKYIRKSFVPQLHLAARRRNYYSGLKRTFARINPKRKMAVERGNKKEKTRELCGKDRKQFH